MKCIMLVLSVVLAAEGVAAQTQTGTADSWTVPRTSDGHPDLQAIWTAQTFTPLQRPERFAGKAFLTEEEAAQLIEVLTAEGVDPLKGSAFARALAEEDADERRGTTVQTDPTHYDNAMWLRTAQPKRTLDELAAANRSLAATRMRHERSRARHCPEGMVPGNPQW